MRGVGADRSGSFVGAVEVKAVRLDVRPRMNFRLAEDFGFDHLSLCT
jgi:hypothetical protein